MNKLIVYIIIGLLLLGIIILTFFPGIFYVAKDSAGIGDKCQPGQGYTEESWREHMSHHPDLYKECLEK